MPKYVSVGGKCLEVAHVFVPGVVGHVVRIWVVDTYNAREPMMSEELCVYVKPSTRYPRLGEQTWWHGKVVFFGEGGHLLEKVGQSFPAPSMMTEE